MTIWLVSTAYGSDSPLVVAAFESKESADKYASELDNDNYRMSVFVTFIEVHP